LHLTTFKLDGAFTEAIKDAWHGGEKMETISRGKITIAIIALCFVIVATSLLSVIYYTQAVETQNNSNAQIATLQAQKGDLQHQVDLNNAEITNLNTQLTNLNNQLTNSNTQLTSLSTENLNLKTQVNSLSDWVDDLAMQVAKLETPQRNANIPGGPWHIFRM
jgi:cell division protein FtsB